MNYAWEELRQIIAIAGEQAQTTLALAAGADKLKTNSQLAKDHMARLERLIDVYERKILQIERAIPVSDVHAQWGMLSFAMEAENGIVDEH